MKTMRQGPVPGLEDTMKLFTEEEKTMHLRSNHATYDPRCELCVQTRGLTRHTKRTEAETVNFDYAIVKNIDNQQQVHTLLIGGGPRGETFARRVPRKGAKLEDLEKFLEVVKSRYGQITCMSDQEECLVQVLRPAALKLGLPVAQTPVEQYQANGRAEQRVRTMKERLHITVAESRKAGIQILNSTTLTSWAVRHAEWTANHLVRNDVEMVDGTTIKVSPFEAHTGQSAPTKLAAYLERILVRAREEDPKQPRWKVGWLLGMVGGDVVVLEENGASRRYGAWRHSPVPNDDTNKEELEKAVKLIKEPNFKTTG